MLGTGSLLGFVAAALVVLVTPGPGAPQFCSLVSSALVHLPLSIYHRAGARERAAR
jgi:hypothetical protein